MKILYGVSGEGFGHSSRAKVIAKHLEEKGHKVIIVTYGQAYKVLKKQFKIFKVHGLHLYFKNNKLNEIKTIKENIKKFPKNLLIQKKFKKLIKEFKPDLCLSDMEPIVPILSFWNKLPLISIDNQHRLTNLKMNVPKEYKKDFLLAKNVVNTFIRTANYFIVISFTNAQKIKKNTIIVPPIIREEVKKLKPEYKKKILIYLTKKDKKTIKILQEIKERFIIYGYNIKKKQKNLEFRKRETFLQDLKQCKAIIASSGFSLMSEAIYLNKPYLAIPLQGQFEQTLNSLFLKKAKFGDYTDNLCKEDINNFLKNLEKYKKNLKKYNPDYNKIFKSLDKILKTF